MQGLFYGIGAAVIAIIGRSAFKLIRSTLSQDWLLWSIFLMSAVVTAWTESEIVWLFLLAGVISLGVQHVSRSAAVLSVMVPVALTSGIHGLATAATMLKIFWYFAEAGAFVFGSGLAAAAALASAARRRIPGVCRPGLEPLIRTSTPERP